MRESLAQLHDYFTPLFIPVLFSASRLFQNAIGLYFFLNLLPVLLKQSSFQTSQVSHTYHHAAAVH